MSPAPFDAVERQTSADWYVLSRMMAVGAVVGSILGFWVGVMMFDEEPVLASRVALSGLAGVLPGIAGGVLLAVPPAVTLLALQSRTARPARGVQVAVPALVAGAFISLVWMVVTGFHPVPSAVGFSALVTGVPAGLTAAWLSRSDRSTGHREGQSASA